MWLLFECIEGRPKITKTYIETKHRARRMLYLVWCIPIFLLFHHSRNNYPWCIDSLPLPWPAVVIVAHLLQPNWTSCVSASFFVWIGFCVFALSWLIFLKHPLILCTTFRLKEIDWIGIVEVSLCINHLMILNVLSSKIWCICNNTTNNAFFLLQ